MSRPAAEMDRLVEVACAAWPAVDNPANEFRTRLASLLDDPGQDERVATSLWLAMACVRGDARALKELEAVAFVPARRALARMGLSADAIEEAAQTVRERMLVASPPEEPRLLAAAKHGDLPGIVRVAAVRSALNHKRKDHRLKLGDEHLMIELCPDDDPEIYALKVQHRALFKSALEQALKGLEPRERNILRMHLLHGLAIDAIGATYQVHRATAARWLAAIRERLDDETRRIIRERERLTEPEVDSLVRLVQSRIEVSFSRILDATGIP